MDASLYDVILLVGFAARLTRLAVVDDIAEPARVAVVRAVPIRLVDWAQSLVSCPFCIGFWLSAAVVASWAAWGSTVGWQLTAGAFTLSYVAGHLVARLDVEVDDV